MQIIEMMLLLLRWELIAIIVLLLFFKPLKEILKRFSNPNSSIELKIKDITIGVDKVVRNLNQLHILMAKSRKNELEIFLAHYPNMNSNQKADMEKHLDRFEALIQEAENP